MKIVGFRSSFLSAAAAAALMCGFVVTAAESNESSSARAETQALAPRLPYGTEDILKLSRSQISEDIILNYVQNSGTVYSLSPNDIVYLKNEGVSDRVINAMLEKKRRATDSSQEQAPAVTQPQPAPAPAQTHSTPASAAPAPTYVQPSPPSTVYVIPYPAASAAYYGYCRPYYYRPYYYRPYYYGPSVSFGFGFGGNHHHHGYHHWRGGWCR